MYIIEQSLSLPAILHCLSRVYPSFISLPFKCSSFEDLLKDASDVAFRDLLISKTDNLTSTLSSIKSLFPDHFCSDFQIVIHLITTLIYKWLDQKTSLCFVPLTFSGKNSLTIYLADKSPQVISECVSSSRSSNNKKCYDNCI